MDFVCLVSTMKDCGIDMKNLFKSTKVIYDAHLKEYQVYYKNFLFWHFDSCYKFDERGKDGHLTKRYYYFEKHEAEKQAIERASAMLDTVEVWKKSNIQYFI